MRRLRPAGPAWKGPPALFFIILISAFSCGFSGLLAAGRSGARGSGPDEVDRKIHPVLLDGRAGRGAAGRSPFLAPREAGRILVRVRAADPVAFAPEAVRLGAEVHGIAGPVVSVEVPEGALRALAALPGVVSVKPAKAYRPMLDISTVEALADPAAASWGGTGRGVIVAVIDTGLDFRHQDFRNADGTSRALAVWDQTDAAGGGAGCGAGFFRGRCFTKAQLDADLAGGTPVAFSDGHGHGTHVAGIAAGNGRATANGVASGTYAGVAPEADLLIVKVFTSSGAYSGDIVAGLSWIQTQAAAAGKPFVVNMSLGTDFGPHDGSDLEEAALDAILAPGQPGRAAAISSGNSRNAGIHVSGSVAPGASNDHPFLIPSYAPLSGADNDLAYFDLWYEGGDNMTVSLLDGAGNTLASAARGATSGLVCTAFGGVVVDATNSNDPDNQDSEVVVSVADDGRCAPVVAPPANATLKIRVTGVGSNQGGGYHAWVESAFGSGAARARFTAPVETTLTGMPGTAARAVTVGSYITRNCWPSADPNTLTTCFSLSGTMGGSSGFSSNGPTRDGRSKPEIAAPGEWIASSLSSLRSLPASRKTKDGFHWTLQGTSMAAPHVAGALAILLQLNPSLDAEQSRALLTGAARADAGTGAVPNAIFGAGKLSVLGAAENVLKPVAGLAASASGGSTLLSWPSEPHSTSYNVYRGEIPGWMPGSYGTCLAPGLAAPGFADAATPPAQHAFFYLVTGLKDGIEGSLGFDGSGNPRPNVTPCP